MAITISGSGITSANIADGTITTDDILASDVKNLKSGRKNLIINGGFDVWQRGTSFTAGSSYTADRWLTDSVGSHTRVTDAPSGFAYSLKLNPTSGNAVVRQAIELPSAGIGGVFESGQQFTLSFWLKSSVDSESINLYIASSNGVTGTTTQMVSSIGIATTTTGWVKYTYTYTQPSAVGASDICYNIVLYVTTPTGDIYFTGIQLELGSVATDFEHRSYGEELALCQRYYQKSYSQGYYAGNAVPYGSIRGWGNGTVISGAYARFPSEMRSQPSVTLYDLGGSVGKMTKLSGGGVQSNGIAPNQIVSSASGISSRLYTGDCYETVFHYTADAEL